MKKLLVGILGFCLFIFSFSFPSPALAHFFETDGTITTELHVEPNDIPIPGENAFLNFDISDTKKKFTIEQCTCTLSIFEGKKEIFHTLLTPRKDTHPSIYDATLTYAFPEKALYDIVLVGKPKTIGTFQPFTLTWDFRVTQNPKEKPIDFTKTMLLYFGTIVGAFLILGLLFFGVILIKRKLNS